MDDPLRRENGPNEMIEGVEIKRLQSGAPAQRTMFQNTMPLDYPIHEAKLCDDCGFIAPNLDLVWERACNSLQHHGSVDEAVLDKSSGSWTATPREKLWETSPPHLSPLGTMFAQVG